MCRLDCSTPILRSCSNGRIDRTYLVLHNALLEPRPAHGDLPGILTPRPDALVVWRLCNPHLLGLLRRLLQDFVKRALGRGGQRIGLGDIRLCIALDGVVGGDLVAGRCCRRVAGEGAGASRCTAGAQGAKGDWEHIGRGVGADGLRNCLGKIPLGY